MTHLPLPDISKQKKFDVLFLQIALQIAKSLSRAVRLKTAAVIVKDGNILSFGYNGTPSGEDNICEERIYKDGSSVADDNDVVYFDSDARKSYILRTKDNVIHAEENAILKLAKGTSSSAGATIYITHAPCIRCARMIRACGIERVVYNRNYRDSSGLDYLKKYITVVQYEDSVLF